MLPVISCIVPVYNGERYLAETLNSIVGQTYRPLEIIVVDDGSTDGSARIAEAFGPRVQYCWQEMQGKRQRATASWVWHKRNLSLFSMPTICGIRRNSPGKSLSSRKSLKSIFVSLLSRIFGFQSLPRKSNVIGGSPLSQPQSAWSTSTVLARRSIFARFGNFTDDGSLSAGSESMIWFLRAQEQGALITVLPEVLMYRRMHPANCSRMNPLETFFPILKEWRDYQRRSRGC
jgi:hypothetical protein